jgi:hypothetical protein
MKPIKDKYFACLFYLTLSSRSDKILLIRRDNMEEPKKEPLYVESVTSLDTDFSLEDKNYALEATYVLIGATVASTLTLAMTNQFKTPAVLIPIISGLGAIFYGYEAYQTHHNDSKVKRK